MAESEYVQQVPIEDWLWKWGSGKLGTLSPGAEGLVSDKFNEVRQLIDGMTQDATEALDRLAKLDFGVPTTAISPINVNPPAIPAFINRTIPPPVGLETTFPTFDAVAGTLLGLPGLDLSGIIPTTPPADVDATLTWVETNYSGGVTALLQSLITSLSTAPAYSIGVYLNSVSFTQTAPITPAALVPSSLLLTSTQALADYIGVTLPVGLGAEAEAEIYARALERQALDNADKYREIEEYFASRGFSLPTGALADALQTQANRIALYNLDLNAKILVEQAEILNKNRQFIDEFNQKGIIAAIEFAQKDAHQSTEVLQKDRLFIQEQEQKFNLAVAELEQKDNQTLAELTQKDVQEINQLTQKDRMFIVETYQKGLNFAADATKALEGIIRDYESKSNDRGLDYAKAAAANIINVYAEKIKAYAATTEANKAYIQAQAEVLRYTVEYNKGLIAFFQGEVQAYLGEVEALAKKNDALIAVSELDVKVYDVETRGYAAYCDAIVKAASAEIENAELALRASITNAENTTAGIVAENTLTQKVAEAVANVTSQILASALGSVNASAGVTDSYGRSHSESFGHTESRNYGMDINNSLTESHSYSEV